MEGKGEDERVPIVSNCFVWACGGEIRARATEGQDWREIGGVGRLRLVGGGHGGQSGGRDLPLEGVGAHYWNYDD